MSEYPVVLTYTTYHCGVCRAIVSAICKSHPTAKIVSVENYTDGRPPSNPWNSKFLTVSKTHAVAAAITYQRAADAQKKSNGNTVQRASEVVEKPSKERIYGKESQEGSSAPIKGKRGRPKGAKKCSKCQRFHLENNCLLST